MRLEPKPGFDWAKVKFGRPDEPVSFQCSYCGAEIHEDACQLRMWSSDGFGAVFCDPCARKWFGLEFFREDEGGGP